ncbi:hypothetical protein CS063_10980 [Sporanaerobium hydrogeniformans]|uniref:Uncharacterized protein n=1 Tax=Sporanaerobium hydrogeniformans TaxID=3072179 RepID=A0AC61DAY8_9FIRM|nr:hypothetical protein [Sporanaerobium hydrogeniformans]PHV70395.1 hypothetical protein CS063_10980 [Sporanaerobium hydrogeniformans]
MQKERYLENISEKLAYYCTIEREKQIGKEMLDLYGSCSLMLGRTLLSPKDIIDKFETNEHILIKTYEEIGQEEVNQFLDYLKELPSELVKPHAFHKSTYINGIMVGSTLGASLDKKLVKRFKYEKIYTYYLKGFCEIRLIVITLDNQEFLTNRAGKRVKRMYLPTSFYK